MVRRANRPLRPGTHQTTRLVRRVTDTCRPMRGQPVTGMWRIPVRRGLRDRCCHHGVTPHRSFARPGQDRTSTAWTVEAAMPRRPAICTGPGR